MSDVAVVGGGVIGRSVALALAEAGASVDAIYQETTPGQASMAAGAMLGVFSEISTSDDPEQTAADVSLRLQSRNAYPAWLQFIADIGGRRPALNPGLFVIANNAGDDDVREIDAIELAAVEANSRAERVAPSEIPGIAPHPTFRPSRALFMADEGTVDATVLMTALELSVRAHGRVHRIEGQAEQISVADGPRVEVRVQGRPPKFYEQVVLAVGVATTSFVQDSGLDLGLPLVLGGRGVSTELKMPFALPIGVRTPNRGFACGLHLVPRENGSAYLGATNRLSVAPDVHQRPRAMELATLLTAAAQEFNGDLRDAEVLQICLGFRPVVPDRLPIVGRTRVDPVLVASGTYRNGILLAPLVARVIEEELTSPGIHASHPWSPTRSVAPLVSDNALYGAVGSLIDTLLAPGGRLPDRRHEELQRFIYLGLKAVIDPAQSGPGLARARRLLGTAPMQEAIPLLYESIARRVD